MVLTSMFQLRYLYDYQDSVIEHKWPTDSGLLSFLIMAAGDIYRELTADRICDCGYISEKTRFLNGINRLTVGDFLEIRDTRIQYQDYPARLKDFLAKVEKLEQMTAAFNFKEYSNRRKALLLSLHIIKQLCDWGITGYNSKVEDIRKSLVELEKEINILCRISLPMQGVPVVMEAPAPKRVFKREGKLEINPLLLQAFEITAEDIAETIKSAEEPEAMKDMFAFLSDYATLSDPRTRLSVSGDKLDFMVADLKRRMGRVAEVYSRQAEEHREFGYATASLLSLTSDKARKLSNFRGMSREDKVAFIDAVVGLEHTSGSIIPIAFGISDYGREDYWPRKLLAFLRTHGMRGMVREGTAPKYKTVYRIYYESKGGKKDIQGADEDDLEINLSGLRSLGYLITKVIDIDTKQEINWLQKLREYEADKGNYREGLTVMIREQTNNGFKANPNLINRELAMRSHSGTSYDPEKRGVQEIAEFVSYVQEFYERLKKHAKTDLQKEYLLTEMERFQSSFASKYNAKLSAQGSCMSTMIAGPSKFPTGRAEKACSAADKRYEELIEFRDRAEAAILRELKKMGVEEAGGEVEVLKRKIEQAEKLQEMMVEGNKIVRKKAELGIGGVSKKQQLINIGFTERQAAEALVPDYMGRTGFPSFALTNNSANIRRMKERLVELEKREVTPTAEIPFTGGYIIDNREEDRVQIFFDQKPPQAMIDKLKSEGWRWAPSVGAWSRKRTDMALNSARRITGAAQPPAPAVQPQAAPPVTAPQPYALPELRWVYGTRDRKWHLVGHEDRDYAHGITQERIKTIGPEAAKAEYLSPSLARAAAPAQQVPAVPEKGKLDNVIALMEQYVRDGKSYEDFVAGLKGYYLPQSGYQINNHLDAERLKADLEKAGYYTLSELWNDTSRKLRMRMYVPPKHPPLLSPAPPQRSAEEIMFVPNPETLTKDEYVKEKYKRMAQVLRQQGRIAIAERVEKGARDPERTYKYETSHRDQVVLALAQGKTVSPIVLKDYPDIVARIRQENEAIIAKERAERERLLAIERAEEKELNAELGKLPPALKRHAETEIYGTLHLPETHKDYRNRYYIALGKVRRIAFELSGSKIPQPPPVSEKKESLIDTLLNIQPGKTILIEYGDIPKGAEKITLPLGRSGTVIERRGNLVAIGIFAGAAVVAVLYVQKDSQMIRIRPIPHQKMQTRTGDIVNTPEYNRWVERIRTEAPEYLPEWEKTAKEPQMPVPVDYPDLIAKKKEPWEMTQEEYWRAGAGGKAFEGRGTSDYNHKQAVYKAILEGKPVPANVLKDYPDLTKKEVPEPTGYFTLKKAQGLIRENNLKLSDEQLHKKSIQLRDYIRFIESPDEYSRKTLVKGGYYAGVIDPYATGMVPVDLWLHQSLRYTLDEVLKEQQRRKQEREKISVPTVAVAKPAPKIYVQKTFQVEERMRRYGYAV